MKAGRNRDGSSPKERFDFRELRLDYFPPPDWSKRRCHRFRHWLHVRGVDIEAFEPVRNLAVIRNTVHFTYSRGGGTFRSSTEFREQGPGLDLDSMTMCEFIEHVLDVKLSRTQRDLLVLFGQRRMRELRREAGSRGARARLARERESILRNAPGADYLDPWGLPLRAPFAARHLGDGLRPSRSLGSYYPKG